MLAETLAIIVNREEGRTPSRTTVPVTLVERATTRPRLERPEREPEEAEA